MTIARSACVISGVPVYLNLAIVQGSPALLRCSPFEYFISKLAFTIVAIGAIVMP